MYEQTPEDFLKRVEYGVVGGNNPIGNPDLLT
jgi:hypothetical protein